MMEDGFTRSDEKKLSIVGMMIKQKICCSVAAEEIGSLDFLVMSLKVCIEIKFIFSNSVYQ